MVGSFRSNNHKDAVELQFLDDRDYGSLSDDGGDEDDSSSEGASIASSVPTTVPSIVDERTAASIMAQKESQRVFFSKLMVISIFLVVAVFVSVAVYGFANLDEKENVQQVFNSYANDILDVSNVNFKGLLSKLSSFGISITGLAMVMNATWPFVAIPNFEAQAQHFLAEASANTVFTAMWVSNNDSNATTTKRKEWENFSVLASSQSWILEGYDFLGLDPNEAPDIVPYIFKRHANGTTYRDPEMDTDAAPLWMASPTNLSVDSVNYNVLGNAILGSIIRLLVEEQGAYAVSPPSAPPTSAPSSASPQSIVGVPIFKDFEEQSEFVATLFASVAWNTFFSDIIDEGVKPIDLIVEDTCGSSLAFSVDGPVCSYKGVFAGDVEDHPQSEFGISSSTPNLKLTNGCSIQLHLFPSTELVESAASNRPWIYTLSIILVFCVTFVFFLMYDRCVSGPDKNKLVEQHELNKSRRDHSTFNAVDESEHGQNPMNSLAASRHGGIVPLIMAKPIADLHPNTTVLFADIANFMAWSSVREPTQVFMLLETLFNAYDSLAKKFKVFKVETIGDCYVAVTGLKEACPDHAVLMAKFAHGALLEMKSIVKQLEVMLGPDTAELAMRVGLHSGPVTAGVLRGEKSRFQLFGATVNTASTIESTGLKNRIHASCDTAEQIRANGYERWLIKREQKVQIKGKGEIETYWVKIDDGSKTGDHALDTGGNRPNGFVKQVSGREQLNMSTGSILNTDAKTDRLIAWSADLLLGLLKRIIAMRESEEEVLEKQEFEAMVQELDGESEIASRINNIDGLVLSKTPQKKTREPKIATFPGQTVLDEVKEIITLPRKANKYQQDPNLVPISQDVVDQLTTYVTDVANMYRDNPFHNFEHASHVTQSLTKLLSRVVTENEIDYDNLRYKKKAGTSKLHRFTFGITSDPITQFACALSAIIHDLDHPGVPNTILVKEETRIAQMYKNKSVAEQNSVDLAWSLLMEPRFKDLRACIYKNQNELDRFRQLVVNSVMATDIVDKELGALRKSRWAKAFNTDGSEDFVEEGRDEVNRKATIVIEHLIQAADVAHTMQHWHVYLKWNERFFHECYQVYLSGRSETDPSEGWYKGEIGFFDFYIIPLAKKLENCGVFGVSSDECLQYATANRNEWERKGKDIVATYLSAYENGRRIS